jgi:1-phosphofructokinase
VNDSDLDAARDERVNVAIFAPAPLLSIEAEPRGDGADIHLHVGGQGFWVARMVRALGADAVLCAPFGGESGRVLRALTASEAIDVRGVEIDAPNAARIEDHRSDRPTIWAESPPTPLGRHEADELYTIALGAAIEAGTCIVAGIPTRNLLGADTYRRLVADLVHNGVAVVADVCGEPLRAALAGGLPLLKVSHEELVSDGWMASGEVADVVAGIEALRDAGARDVVVSRADEPAIASWGDARLELRTPKLEVVEPRGAGDAMTAALGVALARGLDRDATLRLAVAAGALNVTRHGLASGHADAIEQLATKVEITPVAVAARLRQ